MQTTLRLDESLLREAKAEAARGGTSLTRFIEEAVRLRLLKIKHRGGATKKPVELPTMKLVLKPGMKLESNREIWEILTAMDLAEGKIPSL